MPPRLEATAASNTSRVATASDVESIAYEYEGTVLCQISSPRSSSASPMLDLNRTDEPRHLLLGDRWHVRTDTEGLTCRLAAAGLRAGGRLEALASMIGRFFPNSFDYRPTHTHDPEAAHATPSSAAAGGPPTIVSVVTE